MRKKFEHAIGLPADVDGGRGGRQKEGLKERGDEAMTKGQLPKEPPEASEGRPLSHTPPSAPRPAVRFGSDSPQSSQPLPTAQQPLSPLRPPSSSESDSDSDSDSDSRSSPSFPRASRPSHSADQDILTPSSGPDDAPPQPSSPSASPESSTTGEQLESPTVNESLPLEPLGLSHAKSARTEEEVLSEWKQMKERLFKNAPPELKTEAGERVLSKKFKGMKGMKKLLAGTVYCYDSREASSASDSLLRAPLTLTEEKQLEDVAGKGALIFKKIDRGNTQSSESSESSTLPEVVVHAWLSMHARQEVRRLAPKLYGIVSTKKKDQRLGTESTDHWSVSEFISGGSLDRRDAQEMLRKMSFAEKANLCLQLLRHVEELHLLGIAHGDLSLGNLLLRRRGRGYELLLNDFETAVAALDKKGEEKWLEAYEIRGKGGTKPFMAPEKYLMSPFAQGGKDQDGRSDGGSQDCSKDLVWCPFRNDIWACGVLIYMILKNGIEPWKMADEDNNEFKSFANEHKYNLVSFAQAVSEMETKVLDVAGSALAMDPIQRPSMEEMVEKLGHAIGLPTDGKGGSGGRKKEGLKERGDQVMTEGQLPIREPPEASEGRPLSHTPPSAPRPAVRFGSDGPQSSQPLPTAQQPLSPLRPPSSSESDSDSDSDSDSRSSPSFPRASRPSHSADQDILTPSSGPDDAPPQPSSPSASPESSTTGEQLESPTVNESLPLEPLGLSHAKSARTEEEVLSEWKQMKERLFKNVPPELKTEAGERVLSKNFNRHMEEFPDFPIYLYDLEDIRSGSKAPLLSEKPLILAKKRLQNVAEGGVLMFKRIDRRHIQSSVPEVVIHAWLSQHARKEVKRMAPKLYGIVSTEGGEQWSVSEFISGGSLDDCNAREMLGNMSLAEKANLCLQLLRHVKALHSLGIAHGDLSLANLLLRRQGDGYELLLNDFETAVAGLDKKGKEKRIETCGIRGKEGTKPFMAPERYLMSSFAQRSRDEGDTGDGGNPNGSKDLVWCPFRNDIWACGVLIYTILKNRRCTWERPDAEANDDFKSFANEHKYNLVSYAGAVSAMETKVLNVAGSALAMDPMQRPSMEEMVKKLKHAIGLPTNGKGGSGGRKKEGLEERGDQVMTEGQLPIREPPEASEGRPLSHTPPSDPRPALDSSQPLLTAQQPRLPPQLPSPSESRASQLAQETPPDGPDGAPRQPSPLRARLCRVREGTGNEGFLQSTASSRLKEVQQQPCLPPARLRRLRWVTGNERFLQSTASSRLKEVQRRVRG
ncbi:unnamed protein product [Vitrella brassicaformis CCMP3155]|uniref:Protein kinase domain-containing protein n=1 Tax=Vitrella brassicaformis (strain CCMP3155) TaxID=1169540 RepID=A0A0G4ERD4_VITBC|nr:unnamed protein product [Vitrella brassicaformis CCMP3155]|eukprot:CEM00589.1 unnamed protein product [Vitrella brassicaformis CCMP3155]